MAALAPARSLEAPAAALSSKPRPRQSVERRPRVAGGIVWIALIGVLLGGVVFMNVAVLRLNLKLDKNNNDRTQLRAQVADLSSQLSSANAAARVQAQARGVGLRPVSPGDVTYVTIPQR